MAGINAREQPCAGRAAPRHADGLAHCAATRLGALAALLLLVAAGACAAQAAVYRCAGPQGEIVYAERPDGYAHCKAVHVTPQSPLANVARGTVLRGAVYRVVGSDGNVVYTNVKPGRGGGHVTRLFTYIDTCVACVVHSPIDWATVPLDVTSYAKAVRAAAAKSGVSPAFLRAVIHAESAYDPNAVSSKGAQGLMQLMPDTADDMGVADAFNASQNIDGGARYLAQLLTEFHGDRRLAAAAYNAGPKAVRKYDGVPPFAETRVYVKRVGELYQRYAKALGGGKLAVATGAD